MKRTLIKLSLILSIITFQGCFSSKSHLTYPQSRCVLETERFNNTNCYLNPNTQERQECLSHQNQLREAPLCH
ncbi:MAG: hypothetical protein WA080_00065 [Sulfuricurvum sp.]